MQRISADMRGMREARYIPLCLLSFPSGSNSSKFQSSQQVLPYQTKFTFMWDVQNVLQFLITIDCHKKSSLKDLTWKLAMRLALTSLVRSSDISFFDTNIWWNTLRDMFSIIAKIWKLLDRESPGN